MSIPARGPAGPRYRPPCGQPLRASKHWNWGAVDTLTGPEQPSTVLDGLSPRSFTKLSHSSIGRSGAAARILPSLVRLCGTTGATQDKYSTLSDGRVMHMVAVAAVGPSGDVHAVAVWVGAVNDALPPPPVVGSIEWNASGVAVGTPAAHFLLRLTYGELANVHTMPEFLANFDHWGDRAGFLALFNLNNPNDRWTGTATRVFEDGITEAESVLSLGLTLSGVACGTPDG